MRIEPELASGKLLPHEPMNTLDPAARMTYLALTFPLLSEETPVIAPWDQDKLNNWLIGGGSSHGTRVAGKFLLYVWNPGPESPWAGRFKLDEALGTWDVFHRFAFVRWVESPFWP